MVFWVIWEPSISWFRKQRFVLKFQRTSHHWIAGSPIARGPKLIRKLWAPIERVPTIWFLVSVLGLVCWFYVWIYTAGTLTKGPGGRQYYQLLANAFNKGQFHLLEKPTQALLNSEHPYDYRKRGDIPLLWDASFYNSKYYLYWGPAPSLIVYVANLLGISRVRDAGLTLLFVGGTFIFGVFLLREIYRHFQGRFPRWAYLGGVLVFGLNAPLIWLLTRPSIYEAAISGGQFFLIAGLYWLISALCQPKIQGRRILLASISFGFGIATRINLLPTILFLLGSTFGWFLLKNRRDLRQLAQRFLALATPFSLATLGLGWYNFARFGSALEFGHRFQLTGLALPADYDRVLSVEYMIPNLFNYVFRIPVIERGFPYVIVPWIKDGMWPFFIRLPEYYYFTEPVSGVIWILPFVIFTLLVIFRWGWLWFNGFLPHVKSSASKGEQLLSWLIITLSGMVIIELLILLFFISSSQRYAADFSPTLILLGIVFSGWLWMRYDWGKWFRRGFISLWNFSVLLTNILGVLIGITGYGQAFEKTNPELYGWLRSLFP